MVHIAKSIMIVDDEAQILNALRRLLTRSGWQVSAFMDPLAALNYASSTLIPVVISDYRMPGMNGVDFLNELNKIQPAVYKVMLSGKADQDAVINAINQANINHFIHKPWDNEQLILQLEKGLKLFCENHQKELQLNKNNLTRQEFSDWYTTQLEATSPGITHVRRNEMGWIEVDDHET